MSAVQGNDKRTDLDSLASAIESINNYFRFLSGIGCKGFDCSKKSKKIVESWGKNGEASKERMDDIWADMEGCRLCRLCMKRTNIVLGAGDSQARLVFVGEAPGYDEDRMGQPFVGAAGNLLTRIIKAIELSREKVYICNIVKCRPPGNRNPMPDEIKACLPFLKRQLAAIKPNFICALGTVAVQALLNTNKPISVLRGKFYDYGGIKLIPTYHPAYLLRNPEKKRDVWEDMKKLMEEYKKL